MPEGRDSSTTSGNRNQYPWFGIFRCFQIALDPRKLVVAALGIVVMSFLWWLLSQVFWYKAPNREDAAYSNATIQKELGDNKKPGTNELYKEEDYRAIGDEHYRSDLEQWRVLDSLAGAGGKLRTLPWYEYRGPNPYLLVTDVISGTAHDRQEAVNAFLIGTVPVLVEPLNKLLVPVAKLISPGTSPWTRLYLILILFCFIAVWAFCGGVITRLAAVQLANKGPMSLKQAIKFVCNRYLAYLGAPAVPLLIVAAIAIFLWVYGLIGLIPFIGDIFIYGIGLPVIIAAGAVMAIFLVGLVGYPLMYTTLSAEGDQSDTFDALSRSLNYVYQSPWYYIWYWLVAIAYGAAVTFFVLFFVSLTVYVGRWAAGLPASWFAQSRKPEYLFIYTPESFGWRELLTNDSPYAVRGHWVPADRMSDRLIYRDLPVDELAYQRARADYYWYNNLGAYFVCFWVTLMFLMMLGFTYSFFWSASTMIYFLMRKKVDESELDEVFIEEEEPPLPPSSPKIAEGTGSAATSLPVISAPPAPLTPPIVSSPPVPTMTVPPAPAPLPPIPLVDGPTTVSPPATIPFSPPVVSEPSTKTVEEQKRDLKPPTE
jgi:hypothetical protein